MKITEMTNDQAADAMLRLAGPFASFADDEEFMKMMDEIQAMKDGGMPVRTATLKMIPKFVTFGIRRHKHDLYEIIGALTLKPTAHVAKMNFMETIQTVRESWDDVTSSFFPSSGAGLTKSAGSSSERSTGTDGTDGTP